MNENINSSKMEELLLVLEHPELPLHNPAELGARTIVLRRNISYGTQTKDGTQAWDTFMSLVATTRWELVFLNTCATASLELKI